MLLVLGGLTARLARARALWPFAALAVAGSVLFAWLCDAVGERDGITTIDAPVSLWFVAHRTVGEGDLGLLVAAVTTPAVLVGLVLLTALLLHRRGHALEATLLVAATVLAYAAGAVAKLGEHRARPAAPVNLAPEVEPSFPSGHVLVVATVAFVVLGLAWSHLGRAARLAVGATATALTALMALDRLVVGAHWLTDLVGSLALAAVVVAVVVAAHRTLDRSG